MYQLQEDHHPAYHRLTRPQPQHLEGRLAVRPARQVNKRIRPAVDQREYIRHANTTTQIAKTLHLPSNRILPLRIRLHYTQTYLKPLIQYLHDPKQRNIVTPMTHRPRVVISIPRNRRTTPSLRLEVPIDNCPADQERRTLTNKHQPPQSVKQVQHHHHCLDCFVHVMGRLDVVCLEDYLD
jgi:hypothetical protein